MRSGIRAVHHVEDWRDVRDESAVHVLMQMAWVPNHDVSACA